ncbi:hypothetical protein [Flavobacterium sp.]|uniref:hypothetical protein n=1 Tax=Flavobacterium sp. TaxID=239 RepID=UPI00391A015B
MSTGKVILGVVLAATIIGLASKKKSTAIASTTNRKTTVLNWLAPQLSQSERENPDLLKVFDRMSEQELQLIIDVLVKPIYQKPLPANILAQFDALSAKYNIFT